MRTQQAQQHPRPHWPQAEQQHARTLIMREVWRGDARCQGCAAERAPDAGMASRHQFVRVLYELASSTVDTCGRLHSMHLGPFNRGVFALTACGLVAAASARQEHAGESRTCAAFFTKYWESSSNDADRL